MPSLEMESHLTTNSYGNFKLTDAVRPSFDLTVIPQQGYRKTVLQIESRRTMPQIIASISSENLFDAFFDLLDLLGGSVDAVLETSHWHGSNKHADCCREQMDLPILKSFLCSYEELLLNDGCTGIAVLNPETETEVQFDEHKLIFVYAHSLRSFERILKRYGIAYNNQLQFLTDAEHIHTTRDEYMQRFCELRTALGME
jgi:hypothetical protein